MSHHKGELLTSREAVTTTMIGLITGAFYLSATISPETAPLLNGTTQLLEKFAVAPELIRGFYAAELLTSLILANQGRKRLHSLGVDSPDHLHYQTSQLMLKLRQKLPDKKDLTSGTTLYHLIPRLAPENHQGQPNQV